jgi:hypothetical protein
MLAALLMPAVASALACVAVDVSEKTARGFVVYRYAIRNRCAEAVGIAALQIGTDGVAPEPELKEPPKGWSEEAGLPAGAAAAPRGWAAALITQEESETHYLEWRAKGATSPAPLAAGHTLRGFAVTLPNPDGTHRKGHWRLILIDATTLTGRLEAAAGGR